MLSRKLSRKIAVTALHFVAPVYGFLSLTGVHACNLELRQHTSDSILPSRKMSTQSQSLVGRAVVIRKNGGPEVLELIPNFSFPPPGQGEIMIKASAFGVNFADVIIRNGVFGPIPESPTVSNHSS